MLFDEFKGNNSALSQYLWDTQLLSHFFLTRIIYTLQEITIKTVRPIWYRQKKLCLIHTTTSMWQISTWQQASVIAG